MTNNGYKFEKIILKSLQHRSNDNSHFIKSPTPVHPVKLKNSSSKELIFIKSALNDFVGLVNGKFILIESKTTTDNFITSNLKKHQLESLEVINKAGGLSLIIVWFQSFNKVYVVNIKDWNYSRKSITPEKADSLSYFHELKWINPITLDLLNWIKKELE